MMEHASPDRSRPRVTLYLLSCNRRDTVGTALESALAQTYSPLEIVVSDNASTDGSYEVITRLAEAYQGPHRLVLNRNPRNLGLIGNTGKAFELASGELLVMQCDDDRSTPDRVARLVDVWLQHGRAPYVICSSYVYMRATGEPVPGQGFFWPSTGIDARGMEAVLRHYSYRGSSAAYRPEVMRVFGPITEPGCYDDRVLFTRGRLLGDILLVKESLLLYREGGLSANAGTVESAFLKTCRAERASFRQSQADIATLARLGKLREEDAAALCGVCREQLDLIDARITLLEGGLRARLAAFRVLARAGGGQPRPYLLAAAVLPRRVTRGIVRIAFAWRKRRGEIV